MSYGAWNSRILFNGTPAATVPATYTGSQTLLAADVVIDGAGTAADVLNGPWPAWQAAIWPSGAAVDDSRGDAPGVDQFASCEIQDAASWQQPDVVTRGIAGGTNDCFLANPYLHLGTYEIAEFTGGVYANIAIGGATFDAVGDRLMLTTKHDMTTALEVLGVWLNGVLMAAVTSALHTSGDPGIGGTAAFGAAIADTLLLGGLADLDRVEILEDADLGYPIQLAGDELSGVYTSDELRLDTDACRWWSVLVESHEEEIGHTVGDADYAAGSGEARWRDAFTREATEAKPGGDFDWIVGTATENVEDPSLRVCGRLGMHGRNTRAKVWTSFYIDALGAWDPWIEGAWVGKMNARAMRVKVELDRVSLDYQVRLTRVLLAVAE